MVLKRHRAQTAHRHGERDVFGGAEEAGGAQRRGHEASSSSLGGLGSPGLSLQLGAWGLRLWAVPCFGKTHATYNYTYTRLNGDQMKGRKKKDKEK